MTMLPRNLLSQVRMSLSKAKRLYTSKKNSLNRLREPIPTLLYDQSVGAEKLEEARKGCNAA